ncbi:fructosamine kinase family protein [Litorivivens sp.]|uniref:fructosamine kinase family protein n=1 Tax=Litorivivens sp. TaxID=2020868 RepID=UPI0035695DDE
MIHTKFNTTPYRDALLVEARGLEWLRRFLPEEKVSVPEVVSVDERQLQLTEIRPTVNCSSELAIALAEGLAAMHRVPQPYFGFSENNYIGLNPQCNERYEDWGSFFVEQRLLAQVKMIRADAVRGAYNARLAAVRAVLVEYLNAQCRQASLVHGDLWSGNMLCDTQRVWLIDPAVYFADREVDVAMTEMFGGFPKAFYRAYDQALPLSQEYPRKRVIYNLYHALNHYNLFGDGYLSSCEQGFAVLENL